MREYECLYVLHPQVEEQQLGELTERFNHVLTENSAEVLSCNPWGKRRLAYEINHVREGIYVQVRYNGEVGATEELDRALKFSDFVIRHIIVRAEDLDPTQANQVPEELPERSNEDYEDRRRDGRGRRSDGPHHSQQAPSAPSSAEADAAEGEAPAVGEEPVAAAEVEVEAPSESQPEAEAAPVAEAVAEVVEAPEAEAAPETVDTPSEEEK